MKNGHGGAFERASEYGSGEAAEYAAGSGKEKERGTSVGGEKGGTAEEGAESVLDKLRRIMAGNLEETE